MRLFPRTRFVLLLSLLLFGTQLEGQRHALEHIGAALQQSRDLGLQQSTGDLPCVECALLAGGSHAVPASLALFAPADVDLRVVASAYMSQTVPAPAYYLSRAPPHLL